MLYDRSDPAWEQRLLSTPPLRDQHGRRVLLMRTGAWNPDMADFRQACRIVQSSEVTMEHIATARIIVTSFLVLPK